MIVCLLLVLMGMRAQAVSENLWEASENGDVEFASKFRGDWNQTNEEGMTPLMIACDRGKKKMVDLLLDKKVALDLRDREGHTALFYAISAGQVDIVKKLVLAGASVKKVGEERRGNSLFEAVRLGKSELLDFLIQQDKSQLGGTNAEEETPAFVAIRFYQTKALKKLLLSGASSEVRNREGLSLYQVAKQMDYPPEHEIFKILSDNSSQKKK